MATAAPPLRGACAGRPPRRYRAQRLRMAAGGGPVMAAGRGGRRRREELQRGFIEQRRGEGPARGEEKGRSLGGRGVR